MRLLGGRPGVAAARCPSHAAPPDIDLVGGHGSDERSDADDGAGDAIWVELDPPVGPHRALLVTEDENLRKALDERNRHFDLFIGAIGHDLRSPIRTARAMSELAARRLDPELITELLENLVANAIHHARPTVAPVVRVAARRVHDRCGRERALVTVTDIGPGVPPSARERVFEPFVQIDRRSAGDGLGLTVCRWIVDAHGSEIEIGPGPDGVGTTISVWLPAAANRDPR